MTEVTFQRKFINKRSEFKAFVVLEIGIQPFLGMRIKIKSAEYKIVEIIWDTETKRAILRADSLVNHVDDIDKMKASIKEDGWCIEGEDKEEDDGEESGDGKLGTVGKKKKKKKSEDDDSEKVTVPPEDDDDDEKEGDD